MTPIDHQDQPLQPILVILVWRGGERFRRALKSIDGAEHFFSRIILSVTAPLDSGDIEIANQYFRNCESRMVPSKAELICSGIELPTMKHQSFWIDYLLGTGASENDWICWLAYDDEIRGPAIESIVDNDLNWPLKSNVAYLGPWAMRHEKADGLWSGPDNALTECWTSLPLENSANMESITWIFCQLLRPTYLQMSGSVIPLYAHQSLVQGIKPKKLPMRIEMASVLYTREVSEFPHPIVTIYGRPDSDRSAYGKSARREDLDLVLRMTRRMLLHPLRLAKSFANATRISRFDDGSRWSRDEEWRVRGYTRE
jgi:hypothetical protein